MKKIGLLLIIFFSCDNSKLDSFLPKSSGGIREMIVVYDTIFKNGNTIKLVDNTFHRNVEFILQEEPIFNVSYISKPVFSSNRLVRQFRNILYINYSKKDTIYTKKDVFSSPQLAIFINAKNELEAQKIFYKNKEDIINYFVVNDDNYIQTVNKKNRIINPDFLKSFKIDLDIPKDYTVSLQKEDFVWLTKDLKEGYNNIMIFKNTYEQIPDIDFLKTEIKKIRNFWTQKYIHGTLPNTYVKIEDKIDLIYHYTKIDGKFSLKTTGMWKMENDFMGGYFVNYAILDDINNTVYFVDGFIYLPNKVKNPIIVEVDNILKSFKQI